MPHQLTLLKLGGSLITKKTEVSTVNTPMLISACEQIDKAVKDFPDLKLIVGHGSGSFAHQAGAKYETIKGLRPGRSSSDRKYFWHGFFEVYKQAHLLNEFVVKAMNQAGVPAINFPPATLVIASNRTIVKWDTENIEMALENGFVPIIFGDVIFDQFIGGTILSTEDLFEYLTDQLNPSRILLAGIEEGVWSDYPANQNLIEMIDHQTYPQIRKALGGSHATDVTGGMNSKVNQMLDLTSKHPELNVRIFSGVGSHNIYKAIAGSPIGTLIKS